MPRRDGKGCYCWLMPKMTHSRSSSSQRRVNMLPFIKLEISHTTAIIEWELHLKDWPQVPQTCQCPSCEEASWRSITISPAEWVSCCYGILGAEGRGHVDLSLLRRSTSENHWLRGKLHAGSVMGRNERERDGVFFFRLSTSLSLHPSIQIQQSTLGHKTSAHGVVGHEGFGFNEI